MGVKQGDHADSGAEDAFFSKFAWAAAYGVKKWK